MDIFLYNLSKSAVNKIFSTISLNNTSHSYIKNIFTNVEYDKSFNTSHFIPLIYVENLNDINKVVEFIKDKNITFFVSNIVEHTIFNKIKSVCKFVSLSENPNKEIVFYKDLPEIIKDLYNASNKKNIQPTIELKQIVEVKQPIVEVKQPIVEVKQPMVEPKKQLNGRPFFLKNIELNVKEKQLTNNIQTKVDPKDRYREICLNYLQTFRNIPIPNLRLNLNKEAVLVEYRPLPHLEVLLRNMIYNLGNTWSYTIICGIDNFQQVNTFCKSISNNIKIIKTCDNNITQNEYNNRLCSHSFWDYFFGEKILIYQEDTCIFKKNIDDFINYDYVGAPFGAQCVSPVNVGNGGFSLRTKSVMKQIIDACPPETFETKLSFVKNYKIKFELDLYPEDIYYSQCIQTYSLGKISPHNVAKKFASEQVFTDDCLGMHCMWFCNKNWEKYVTDYFENVRLTNTNTNTNVKSIIDNPLKTSNTNIVKKQITPSQPKTTPNPIIPSQPKMTPNPIIPSQIKTTPNKIIPSQPKMITSSVETSNTKIAYDIYFIHCKDFTERDPLIQRAIEQLKQEGLPKITMINGVNTSKVKLDLENQQNILKQYDANLKFADPKKFTFYKGGQIGCYIGHHLAIKQILNNSEPVSKYSIILEDDISLVPGFTHGISKIIEYFENSNTPFDVIYLGTLNKNGGKVKYSNIFEPNKKNWCFGAHGLLINNKSAAKLYEYNCNILHEIDNHYKLLYNSDLINAYYIDRPVVTQNRQMFSYINLKENN